MRIILFLITIAFFCSCNKQAKNTIDKKLYTQQDTLNINGHNFPKEEFNTIIDHFPRLYQAEILHPDSLYQLDEPLSRDFIDAQWRKQMISFDSEAGKDKYFTLYAHFLAQKNDCTRFKYLRKDLTATYQSIINIFERLNRGGTLYSHELSRVPAYVEYDIYFINNEERVPEFTKKTRANRFEFIEELKGGITEEAQMADISYNFQKEKIQDLVKKLNDSIVNDYVLYRAKKISEPYLIAFKESQE